MTAGEHVTAALVPSDENVEVQTNTPEVQTNTPEIQTNTPEVQINTAEVRPPKIKKMRKLMATELGKTVTMREYVIVNGKATTPEEIVRFPNRQGTYPSYVPNALLYISCKTTWALILYFDSFLATSGTICARYWRTTYLPLLIPYMVTIFPFLWFIGLIHRIVLFIGLMLAQDGCIFWLMFSVLTNVPISIIINAVILLLYIIVPLILYGLWFIATSWLFLICWGFENILYWNYEIVN